MSIYITLNRVRLLKDAKYYTITFQGVPGHIGHPSQYDRDPYHDYLPAPPEDPDNLRAVVIVDRAHREKVGQRYVHPIIILSGEEYVNTPYLNVIARIYERLSPDFPGTHGTGGGRP